MNKTKDKIIQKQKELIEHLRKALIRDYFRISSYKQWYDDKVRIEAELTALESQDEVSEVKTYKSDYCDVCKCRPSVLICTPFGTFCQTHARYV